MSVPTDPFGQTPTSEHTVTVDLAAFLPDGVELSGATLAWRPDLEALDAVEADFDAVDEALRALDAGTYGTCQACAQPIPEDQLAATPARATCAAHA